MLRFASPRNSIGLRGIEQPFTSIMTLVKFIIGSRLISYDSE
jgi:hypothetical protein